MLCYGGEQMNKMPALHLDFQRKLKSFSWGRPALIGAAMTVLIATGIYYRELSDQAAGWEMKAERLERASHQQGGHNGAEAADLASEVKSANEVVRLLTLPWEGLFQAVESVSGRDVSLLGLEPNSEKKVVKISGEAKNMAALLDYIRQLEECGEFGTVFLLNHLVQQQVQDKPVRFALLAAWAGKS